MTINVPPQSLEDRLPHERAVWRENHMPPPSAIEGRVQVSIKRRDFIEETTADRVDWNDVGSWRFGWAPPRNPFEGLGLAAKE